MIAKTEKIKMKAWCKCWPGDRPPRFLKPFLLLLLLQQDSHGYELFDKLKGMGLDYVTQDAAYVYKKLRIMEKEGLIKSSWDTEGIGPAKRIYRITPAGEKHLASWEEPLEKLKSSLDIFLKAYRKVLQSRKDDK